MELRKDAGHVRDETFFPDRLTVGHQCNTCPKRPSEDGFEDRHPTKTGQLKSRKWL